MLYWLRRQEQVRREFEREFTLCVTFPILWRISCYSKATTPAPFPTCVVIYRPHTTTPKVTSWSPKK